MQKILSEVHLCNYFVKSPKKHISVKDKFPFKRGLFQGSFYCTCKKETAKKNYVMFIFVRPQGKINLSFLLFRNIGSQSFHNTKYPPQIIS